MRRAVLATLACGAALMSGGEAARSQTAKEAAGIERVSGRFDVTLTPQQQPGSLPNGRMVIAKTFFGALAGTSAGEMLTSSDARNGSGAYVAVERFTGRLGARSGSFYFVHRGIMDDGRPDLSITVVPGSGTGELTGLTGTLTLDMASKNHAFTFDYSLPALKLTR